MYCENRLWDCYISDTWPLSQRHLVTAPWPTQSHCGHKEGRMIDIIILKHHSVFHNYHKNIKGLTLVIDSYSSCSNILYKLLYEQDSWRVRPVISVQHWLNEQSQDASKKRKKDLFISKVREGIVMKKPRNDLFLAKHKCSIEQKQNNVKCIIWPTPFREFR